MQDRVTSRYCVQAPLFIDTVWFRATTASSWRFGGEHATKSDVINGNKTERLCGWWRQKAEAFQIKEISKDQQKSAPRVHSRSTPKLALPSASQSPWWTPAAWWTGREWDYSGLLCLCLCTIRVLPTTCLCLHHLFKVPVPPCSMSYQYGIEPENQFKELWSHTTRQDQFILHIDR